MEDILDLKINKTQKLIIAAILWIASGVFVYFYLFKIAATTVCLDNFVLAANNYSRAVYV